MQLFLQCCNKNTRATFGFVQLQLLVLRCRLQTHELLSLLEECDNDDTNTGAIDPHIPEAGNNTLTRADSDKLNEELQQIRISWDDIY